MSSCGLWFAIGLFTGATMGLVLHSLLMAAKIGDWDD